MAEVPAGVLVLTPAELARLYRVSVVTVTRWADEGKAVSFRTPGGHRRFPAGQFGGALPGGSAWSGEDREFLTPAEVAAAFRVSAKTVRRWAAAGYLKPGRTPGGRPRYRAAEVRALMRAQPRQAPAAGRFRAAEAAA